MDILQIVVIFLLFVIAVILSVVGLMAFLILRGLKRSLNKFEKIVGNIADVAQGIKYPLKTVATVKGVTEAVGAGVKIARTIASKKKKSGRKIIKVTRKE